MNIQEIYNLKIYEPIMSRYEKIRDINREKKKKAKTKQEFCTYLFASVLLGLTCSIIVTISFLFYYITLIGTTLITIAMFLWIWDDYTMIVNITIGAGIIGFIIWGFKEYCNEEWKMKCQKEDGDMLEEI